MSKPQARISRDGSIFFDRLELLNYVFELQDRMRDAGKPAEFKVKKAADDSVIFYLNDKIVGREHPGVSAKKGDDCNLSQEEISHMTRTGKGSHNTGGKDSSPTSSLPNSKKRKTNNLNIQPKQGNKKSMNKKAK